jgi:formamidopyrimidine-DNA glycosylase
MPELPDITVYMEALEARLLGKVLQRTRLKSPFLLRTFDPSLDEVQGKEINSFRRLGKRIAIGFKDDLWLILHLMIAGRFHWKEAGAKFASKTSLAAFDFPNGTLLLSEAGTKHRASLHVVRGEANMLAHDPGGLDLFQASSEQFQIQLQSENHTLKRSLTNPKAFDGIGNAYSDEILHHAHLSPITLSRKLSQEECQRLHDSSKIVLSEWIERLRQKAGDGFPEKVTAFQPEMAVHGRFGKPCPVCEAPIQRIRYADNETNYCPGCQTNGRILADRSLSRLLKDCWPRHLDDL